MNHEEHFRTYKDLLQERHKHSALSSFKGIFAGLLSFGIKIPILGKLLQRSFPITCFALGRYRLHGDFVALYTLLINSLIGPQFRKKDSYHWWYLMRFAVAVAQERQINFFVRDLVLEDSLIMLGSLGPKPWKGYDVAYAFVGFSLWIFERGDIKGAINMIEIATAADETWGYPEYLLGWYGLFTTGIDSVHHFTRAVQIDWSFLQRMKHDKTCRQHPDILREVQKKTLVNK